LGVDSDKELADLLRAAIAGDECAYAEFLRRAAKCVRGFLHRRIRHGGLDPEDIVQETLLAIHMKRHTWRTDSPVFPWLFAITRHKAIDAFRRRGRHIEIDVGEIADLAAESRGERALEWEIDRALEGLTPGQRSVVSAVSVDGRSIGETASSLGMSETAVRVALHRGLAAIAKRFGRN
jgi:RNA polymerase sigma-70 factor (ECF subfamily)